MESSPCTWPSEVLANSLKFLNCKDVIALCNTSRECMSKCAEAFNWSDFPSEQKKVAWNCLIHNIFDILGEDTEKTFPPGWEWTALTNDMFEDFLNNDKNKRNIDHVAYISFDDITGTGYFHMSDNVQEQKDTFKTLFGEHPYRLVTENEIEFVDYPYCEDFATEFSQSLNLNMNREVLDNGNIKIAFSNELLIFLHSMVSTTSAIHRGNVRYGHDENVRQFAGKIRYNDYFQDPNAPDIIWVATEPQNIIAVWNEGEDELSISLQVRNPSLRSLVTLSFVLCGCVILVPHDESDVYSWTVLQIPDYELTTLSKTRGGRKHFQRRQFLHLFPFLKCHEVSNTYDKFVDIIPEYRPESFAEAIVKAKYAIPLSPN